MLLYPLAAVILTAGLSSQAASSKHPPAARQTSRSTLSTACDRTPYECAGHAIEHGDFNAAIALLERLLASDSRNLRIRNLLGIAFTGSGQVEEGSRHFREALALDPDFSPARRNLAVNEFNQGRLEAAERLFNEVVARIDADEVAHVHLGEIHYARKQPALALPHYEKGGARLMNNPAWMLHYASCLLDTKRTAEALTVLARLPADGLRRFEAGVLLARAGVYADAARHFGEARSTYKDPYAAGYNQILMLIEAADHDTAIRVAEEMLHTYSKSGELFNLASRAYVGAGRIKDAYDALRAAARLEPNEEQHYADLALICLDHENFDLGMEIVDVGLQYKPGSARLRLYRGVLLVMKGFVERAEREFEAAVKLAPEDAVMHVALAMAWMQSGHTANAVAHLRERMQGRRREPVVAYMFGVALLRSGVDPADEAAAEAIGAFEEAIRLDPRSADARTELGKIFLRRGETSRAIEHLEQAVSLDPDNPAPAYSLAQAYRRTGDTARARELLARVSRLNAQGRGDDPDSELKRMVVRIVREGLLSPAGTGQ